MRHLLFALFVGALFAVATPPAVLTAQVAKEKDKEPPKLLVKDTPTADFTRDLAALRRRCDPFQNHASQ